MRARRTSCLACGQLTAPDPGHLGVKQVIPYCPSCDAVWHKARCVICGAGFLVDVVRHRGGHHCAPGAVRRTVALWRRHELHARPADHPAVGERLRDGFRLWNVHERR
ncbi:MAG: hypothetical protein U0840_24705 [Gemmataceae bacterium]